MRLRAGCITFTLLLIAGCGAPQTDGLLDEAEALILAEDYDAAIPVLRQLLTAEPMNAGGHYYLGLCYLAGDEFRPLIAKGEFQTGLRLFRTQDKVSPIARFSAEYFEMMGHINQAKVTVLEIDALSSMGARTYHIEPLVERIREQADLARAVDPDAEEVAWIDGVVASLTRDLNGGSAST